MRFEARSSLGFGIHSEYRASDTLLLTFDRPTDRAAGRGDKVSPCLP